MATPFTPTLRFAARIEIYNGNPYIPISAEQATQLQPGWRRPMPVLIQINNKPDKPWGINMMPLGNGTFYLYLHGDVRKASQTKVGDVVDVAVSFDAAYHNGPLHPMPAEFREALQANPTAQAAWEALTPSRQKEILRYMSWLKSDEAMARNVAKAIQVLSGKPGRYMARSWKDGK